MSERIAGPSDMTPDAFRRVLEDHSSPALPEADSMYAALAQVGVRQSVFIGFFLHESRAGTLGVTPTYDTRNPGNVRSVADPASGGVVIDTPRGQFVRYPSWTAGTLDWAKRLRGPLYEGAGLRTVAQVIPKYAPSFENDVEAYIRAVEAGIKRYSRQIQQPGGGMEIIDVRDQLPTNPSGGSGERYADKDGVIIHYSGPAVDRGADTMAVLRSYAEYHIGPYLNEAGLAYHYDVGNDAQVRLTRDPDAVLWHCASWPENRTYYAVHVMIGDNQHASAAQLAALGALVDELRQRHGMARANVKGHQEVSATSCPGTLMADFVLPYRAGKEATVADGWRFPETGKYLGGGFYAYWRDRGGLAVFGLPISEEMQENGRTVQYFERAVFEYHPENDPQYRVLLRRLGADAAKAAGLTGAGIAA